MERQVVMPICKGLAGILSALFILAAHLVMFVTRALVFIIGGAKAGMCTLTEKELARMEKRSKMRQGSSKATIQKPPAHTKDKPTRSSERSRKPFDEPPLTVEAEWVEDNDPAGW